MDYIQEDGTFNVDFITNSMKSAGETEENINYILNNCITNKETPELKAWEFFKCKYAMETKVQKSTPNN